MDSVAGRDALSSLPSAVKPKEVVGVPRVIKGMGESSEAEAAMRQPGGIWRGLPWYTKFHTPVPPCDAGAVKVVLPSPSTRRGAVVGRLAKSIVIGSCLKFSSAVASVSALILTAEARRSRIRAATSAVKRPA